MIPIIKTLLGLGAISVAVAVPVGLTVGVQKDYSMPADLAEKGKGWSEMPRITESCAILSENENKSFTYYLCLGAQNETQKPRIYYQGQETFNDSRSRRDTWKIENIGWPGGPTNKVEVKFSKSDRVKTWYSLEWPEWLSPISNYSGGPTALVPEDNCSLQPKTTTIGAEKKYDFTCSLAPWTVKSDFQEVTIPVKVK